MEMSKVLKTSEVKNGSYMELVEYSKGWSPWTHAIRNLVVDGKDYQRAGQETCTGWGNFTSLDKAEAAFAEYCAKAGAK